MKIVKVTDEAIIFDNGNKITFDHEQDCCENNYADFSILDERNVNYGRDFNPDLKFRFIDGVGFMFGSECQYYDFVSKEWKWDEGSDIHWIFIPCYSDQNGYYTTDIDIYYNGNKVISGLCEECFDD